MNHQSVSTEIISRLFSITQYATHLPSRMSQIKLLEGTSGKLSKLKRLLVVKCNGAACDVASGKELQNGQESHNIC